MKLRLLDAVVVASIGLLGLKTLGFFAPGEGRDRSSFARVLSNGHSPYVVPDPETTGSVAAKKAADKEDGKPDDPKTAQKGPAPPAMSRPVSLDPGGAGLSAAERELLESLGQRRDELDARQRELDMRESLLSTAEKKLDARIGDLKAIEGRISAGDRSKPGGGAETARNLVTMYEAMKPKEAARVFDRLSQDILVPMVLQMNARKMAEVLAAMSPEAAQKLTVALAARARMGASVTRDELAGAVLPANELQAVEPPAPSQ